MDWLLLIDTQTHCCEHVAHKDPVADLGRWSWGRWRVSEELYSKH